MSSPTTYQMQFCLEKKLKDLQKILVVEELN